MDPIVLCADSESLRHPEMIGLEGARLDEVAWLQCFSDAEAVRAFARNAPMPQEFWVVSADDMEAINVAAALKHDEPLRTIRLVVDEASGSVLSRAHAASVDETLPVWRFAQRFRNEVQRRACVQGGASAAFPTQVLSQAQPQWQMQGPGAGPGPAEAARESAERDALAALAKAPGSVATAPEDASLAFTQVMEPLVKGFGAAAGNGGGVAPAGRSAFVLSVVSGSGGAGKTTVALYAALIARARGYRTLLIDGDLQFGDLRTILNDKDAPTVADALQAPDPVGLLQESAEGLAFLAAPRKLEEAELCAPQLPRLIDAVAPRFDVVVVSTGASWTDYHAPLLERSTRALFLIDQRASSVRACQHALDVCLRSGIATGSFLFALNRCSRHGLFTSIDVSCALNGAHVIELKEGGSAVEEACGAGLPTDLLHEKNALVESLEELLDELLPEKAESGTNKGRAKGRQKEGAARGERRQSRRAKHGKRERLAAPDEVPFDVTAAAERPVA